MTQFIARRLAGTVASLFLAVTMVFIAIQLTPGDPAQAALSQSTASDDVLQRRRAALGLDRPIHVQYVSFMLNLAHGNLGVSWSGEQPVNVMIGQQIAATVTLASTSMGVAIVAGSVLGVLAAVNSPSYFAQVMRNIAAFLLSTPVMFSGTFFIWIFASNLNWFPATGAGTVRQLVLPSATLGLSVAGSLARVIDGGVTDALGQPYIRTARAKGLTRWQTLARHALRIGLMPTFDVIALQFGYLLGGAVVVENVFARQGLGRLLLTAVLDKDLPVVQGIVILAAFVYSLLNLSADLTHTWLDPRIRLTT